MVTETIDIRVRERGARTVRRRLESIGDTATRSTRGLRLMQNALFVLGGAGIVSGLTRIVDSLTNFENRLRIVTRTSAELNRVQAELFDIANRTRVSFDAVADVYSRTALSVRFLGLSQQEVLNFTESLTQAAVLSGATARETNAALVQLGQGLASNRLSGDELRSVLEQLPFVADIIAEELDTTRGGLRALAKEGEVTTQVILDAFTNAADEIQAQYDRIQRPISSALDVLRNNFLELVDGVDDLTGASFIVADAIISIANSLEFMAVAALSAGAALAVIAVGRVGSALITRYRAAAAASAELTAAVQSGNFVLLTEVEINRARAATALQAATASRAEAAQRVADIIIARRQIGIKAAYINQLIAETQFTVTNGRARNVLTGQLVNQARAEHRLQQLNARAAALNRAYAASELELAAAKRVRAAATATAAAAERTSIAATAAASTLTSRLTRAFPTISLLLSDVRNKFTALFAVARGHPLLAVAAGVVAVTTALFALGDEIAVSADGVVTLRDIMVATWQLTIEWLGRVGSAIGNAFRGPLDNARRFLNRFGETFTFIWNQLLSIVRTVVNGILGAFVGTYRSVVLVWDLLPGAFVDIGVRAVNDLIRVLQGGLRLVIGALDTFFTSIDPRLEGLISPDLIDLEGLLLDEEGRTGVRQIAQEVIDIFTEEFETDRVGAALNAIFLRARAIAEARLVNLDEPGDARPTNEFQQYLEGLREENRLLRLNSEDRAVAIALARAEDKIKRQLTDTEAGIVERLTRTNQRLQQQNDVLEDIQGPFNEYIERLRALRTLYREGRIDQEEFRQGFIQLRLAFLDTQNDVFSGFERGYLRILQQTQDFASQSEEIITTAYEGISDALADLVVRGKADFGSLVDEIQTQLIRLATNQALTALLGNNLGVGGSGGFLGDLLQRLLGFGRSTSPVSNAVDVRSGFQTGGRFRVPGSGGVDSTQVSFRATPGERVTVEPLGQQERGGNVFVEVHNYESPEVGVGVEEQSGPSGERVIRVMVSKALAEMRRTGEIDPYMNSFGARRQLVSRS